MGRKALIGVDIGGTKTAVSACVEPPILLQRIEFPTQPNQGPGPAIHQILDAIRKILASQQLKMQEIQAIGISCGGPLDPINGVIQAPPNLWTWENVPIKSILTSAFSVDVFVENDANAGAMAEFSFGAGRGTRNMIFLTMGTGLGAGLILDGKLYRGTTDAAGEIGHVRLTRSGPSGYHKRGSAEGWASGAGMARNAVRYLQSNLGRGGSTVLTSLLQNNGKQLSAHVIWNAAQSGDTIAHRIIENTGRKLGEAMAILIDLFNPECIVVGGLAVRMGDALLEPARSVVAREALQTSAAVCRIRAAELGEKIGDIAAICIAMGAEKNVR